MLGFLAVPAGFALALALPGLPAQVAPIVLVASGICYFALSVRLVKGLAKLYAGENVEPGHELDDVPGEKMLADKPHAVWVPFLVTGSWMLVLAGLVWLAIVDWRMAAGLAGAGLVLYVWWWLVQPRLRRAETSRRD